MYGKEQKVRNAVECHRTVRKAQKSADGAENRRRAQKAQVIAAMPLVETGIKIAVDFNSRHFLIVRWETHTHVNEVSTQKLLAIHQKGVEVLDTQETLLKLLLAHQTSL